MHTVKYLQSIGERKSKSPTTVTMSLVGVTTCLTRVMKAEQRAMIGVAMGGRMDEGGRGRGRGRGRGGGRGGGRGSRSGQGGRARGKGCATAVKLAR